MHPLANLIGHIFACAFETILTLDPDPVYHKIVDLKVKDILKSNSIACSDGPRRVKNAPITAQHNNGFDLLSSMYPSVSETVIDWVFRSAKMFGLKETKKCWILLPPLLIFQPTLPATLFAAVSVTVGVYDFKPTVFINRAGKPASVYIDVLEQVASAKGWKIQYVPGSWQECLDRLDPAEIDILVSIVYTQERDQRYDFSSETILSTWGQVYVQKGSKIEGILDLHKKTIAVQRGDYWYGEFIVLSRDFNISSEYIEVDHSDEIFGLISTGKVHAGIVERLNGMENEKKYKVERSPIIFSPKALVLATPENKNRFLIEAIDEYLAASKKDPYSHGYTIPPYFVMKLKIL